MCKISTVCVDNCFPAEEWVMLTLTNSKLNILNAFVEVVCIHNLLKHTDTNNSDLSEDTSSVVCLLSEEQFIQNPRQHFCRYANILARLAAWKYQLHSHAVSAVLLVHIQKKILRQCYAPWFAFIQVSETYDGHALPKKVIFEHEQSALHELSLCRMLMWHVVHS